MAIFFGYESHQAVLCAPGNKAVLPDHHHFPNREIAELAGKEHRDVMRDTRPMPVELHGEGGVLTFQHTQVNPQNGQSYPIFKLPAQARNPDSGVRLQHFSPPTT